MGYILALGSIMLWSVNYLIAVHFSQTLLPFEITFGRWFVALFVLIPLAWSGLKHNYLILCKNWKLIFGLAITGIVLQNSMIYFAGRTADPFNMSLLALNGPIFLLILSVIFLHEHISKIQIMGFIIALGGVLFIITQGNLSKLIHLNFAQGDLFVLFNSFCFAIYSLLQKNARKKSINKPS